MRYIKNIEKKEGNFLFINNKKLFNLNSNDYLNIGSDDNLHDEFLKSEYSRHYFSSSSSRLLTGNESIYFKLENLLANLYNKEKCLLFNSGYSANLGIITSIEFDTIFMDKLDHASIIDGVKLSQKNFYRYNHNDYNHLEKLLQKHQNNSLIIVESLYSMDGDFSNINKLLELKNKYNCKLMVDESHAFGVYGKNGLGYCEELNLLQDIDIIMSGLGKGAGSVGGFCVANENIINTLINNARSFIYSTALPPINIAWSYFVIKNVLPKKREEAKKLIELSSYFKTELEKKGFYSNTESYIIPLITTSEELQERFFNNGFYILPIRYPSVPKNQERFRLSLTSCMDYDIVNNILNLI